MKRILFLMLLCVGGMFVSEAQVSKLSKQKIIKGSITLSTGDVIKSGDVLYFDKNRERGKNYEYVFVDEYGGNPRFANRKSVFKKQRITHFKKLDGVYYAYTSGNNIVALEEALKSGEVTGEFARSAEVKTTMGVKNDEVAGVTKREYEGVKMQLKVPNVKMITYPLKSLVNMDLEPVDLATLKSDKSELEIHHMRYCLRKYHENRRIARDIMFGGMACGILGGIFYEDDFGEALIYAGGGLSLASLVVYLVSEKWLKYSTIKPVLKDDQVGITISF